MQLKYARLKVIIITGEVLAPPDVTNSHDFVSYYDQASPNGPFSHSKSHIAERHKSI